MNNPTMSEVISERTCCDINEHIINYVTDAKDKQHLIIFSNILLLL